LSNSNHINVVSDINPDIWSRQIPTTQAARFAKVSFTYRPIWANIYIFYGTNHSFLLPNPSATRIYFSVEPRTLKQNSSIFLNQFDSVYGSIPNKHKATSKYIANQPALPWHLGINFDGPRGVVNLNFADLLNIEPPKIDGVSIITSNKNISRIHMERLEFVQKLSQIMGLNLHIYGRGFNSISDKYEVLKKYRYHVALENCQQESYWSEKLSDPILALNKVFYFGAPNINEFFSSNVVRSIDIANPHQVADLILNEVENKRWEEDFDQILIEKQKVIDQYNFTNLIFDITYEKNRKINQLIIFSDFLIIPRKFFHKLFWLFKIKLTKVNP